jgi:hypothetical protein
VKPRSPGGPVEHLHKRLITATVFTEDSAKNSGDHGPSVFVGRIDDLDVPALEEGRSAV